MHATGQPQEALMLWHSLHNSLCAHPAGMASCRLFFSAGEYIKATQTLQECYRNADSGERMDVVKLWMEQTWDLFDKRRARPLRAYLDIRRDAFAQDDTSMDLAARVLLGMGSYEEVLQQCATLPRRCFQALYRAGQLDEAIGRFGSQVNATTLKHAVHHCGLWERALALPPEIPWMDAASLTELGRPEEAIKRFPMLATGAYLALGQYAELLERIPTPSYDHGFALHALGRYRDLQRLADEYPEFRGEIQLYLEPSMIVSSEDPESDTYRSYAIVLLAIQALNAGEISHAATLIETCKGVESPDLWSSTTNRWVLLLTTVLRGLLLGPQRMQDDFDLILSRFRLHYKQALWHDAAYLAKAIPRDRYMQQPSQVGIGQRILILDAMAHDIGRQKSKAIKAYETALPQVPIYPGSHLLLHRFILWRIQDLRSH